MICMYNVYIYDYIYINIYTYLYLHKLIYTFFWFIFLKSGLLKRIFNDSCMTCMLHTGEWR